MNRNEQAYFDWCVERLKLGDESFVYNMPWIFQGNLFLYRVDGEDAYRFGIINEPITDIGTYDDIMSTRLDVRLLSPSDWPSKIIKI